MMSQCFMSIRFFTSHHYFFLLNLSVKELGGVNCEGIGINFVTLPPE